MNKTKNIHTIKKLIIATTCASILSPMLSMHAMDIDNDISAMNISNDPESTHTENNDIETKESAAAIDTLFPMENAYATAHPFDDRLQQEYETSAHASAHFAINPLAAQLTALEQSIVELTDEGNDVAMNSYYNNTETHACGASGTIECPCFLALHTQKKLADQAAQARAAARAQAQAAQDAHIRAVQAQGAARAQTELEESKRQTVAIIAQSAHIARLAAITDPKTTQVKFPNSSMQIDEPDIAYAAAPAMLHSHADRINILNSLTSNEAFISALATELATELEQELTAKHNKPKHCCIAQSPSFLKEKNSFIRKQKNKKNSQPVPDNATIIRCALRAVHRKIETAVHEKNHLLVRILARDPLVRALWHIASNLHTRGLLSFHNLQYCENLLYKAVENNDLETAKVLIENGFNVNWPGSWNGRMLTYPLDAALTTTNSTMIQYLIDQGASLDDPQRLFNSVTLKNRFTKEALDCLIKNNINCEAIPLKHALEINHTLLIQLIMNKTVMPAEMPAFIRQHNLLDTAIAQANSDLFEWLLSFFLTNNLAIPPINTAKSLIIGSECVLSLHYPFNRTVPDNRSSHLSMQRSISLISIVYSLIKNGIGTNDDYEAVIQHINQSFQSSTVDSQHMLSAAFRHNSSAALLRQQQNTADLEQQLEFLNHQLPIAINAGIQDRYNQIALTRTQPQAGESDLFDIPAICTLIGEYETSSDYQGERSLALYAQQQRSEIAAQKYPEEPSAQQDPMQEYWAQYWEQNHRELLKMLAEDPSLPAVGSGIRTAKSGHQENASVAHAAHTTDETPAAASATASSRTQADSTQTETAYSGSSDAQLDDAEYVCCVRHPDCACAHPRPAKRQRR